MIKLVALYETPKDPAAFLSHYRNVHLPLVRKIPGLLRTEVTELRPAMIGEKENFLLAEMYFADDAMFRAAMKSPENAAAGKDLNEFADGLVTLMRGEVIDF